LTNRTKYPSGVDKHLTPLELETLTPEQRAVRLAILEAEEHQSVDWLIERLDRCIRRRERARGLRLYGPIGPKVGS